MCSQFMRPGRFCIGWLCSTPNSKARSGKAARRPRPVVKPPGSGTALAWREPASASGRVFPYGDWQVLAGNSLMHSQGDQIGHGGEPCEDVTTTRRDSAAAVLVAARVAGISSILPIHQIFALWRRFLAV